eukprot:GEMP01072577.1.p1 GENE.GEMP01072577.1~~GEMP01072577.1.p1  ORF type:complete len:138 (+),score=26.33 GEMP01072577.1:204-617(+)
MVEMPDYGNWIHHDDLDHGIRSLVGQFLDTVHFEEKDHISYNDPTLRARAGEEPNIKTAADLGVSGKVMNMRPKEHTAPDDLDRGRKVSRGWPWWVWLLLVILLLLALAGGGYYYKRRTPAIGIAPVGQSEGEGETA